MSQRTLPRSRQHVVIVGGGFGGQAVAEHLSHVPVSVTLVDRHDYHTFQPLLYQVATALLNAEDVGHPLRAAFRHKKNVTFREATVTEIDWRTNRVLLDEGDPLPFDYLVLAAGATVNYFGVSGAQQHAIPLYTLPDAVRLRDRILERFESADRDPSLLADGALTFVVVGGGPTGVETSGALTDMFQHVLAKDYPQLAVSKARVVLVERERAVIPPYTERLREYAAHTLQAQGVELLLGESLSAVQPTRARFSSGVEVPAHTVIWAGGLHANPLADTTGFAQGAGGRIVVGSDLSVKQHPNVFVVGDLAQISDDGHVLPQLARPAIEAGAHVAKQITRRLMGQRGQPFHYNNPGTMATIGRGAAVCEFPNGVTLDGPVAWLAWLGVHLVELGGMRNRLDVLTSWGWGLLTNERAARISIEPDGGPRSESTQPTS